MACYKCKDRCKIHDEERAARDAEFDRREMISRLVPILDAPIPPADAMGSHLLLRSKLIALKLNACDRLLKLVPPLSE